MFASWKNKPSWFCELLITLPFVASINSKRGSASSFISGTAAKAEKELGVAEVLGIAFSRFKSVTIIISSSPATFVTFISKLYLIGNSSG